MSTAAKPLTDVKRWAAYAQSSGKKWGIPPAVLLGLIHEESGGQEGLTSSAGAGGLTQFMPGTARTYGVDVRPGHAASQIDGAAHYLHDLGFAKDPYKALESYAAGPGNPTAGAFYATNVLHNLAPVYGNVPATTAAASSSPTGRTATATIDTGSGGGLFDAKKRSGLLDALVTVGFVGVGVGLLWQGTNQLTGDAPRKAARAARAGAAVAGAAAA